MVTSCSNHPDANLTSPTPHAPPPWFGDTATEPGRSWSPPEHSPLRACDWTELALRPRDSARDWIGLPDSPRSGAATWTHLPQPSANETAKAGAPPLRLALDGTNAPPPPWQGHEPLERDRNSPAEPVLAWAARPRRSFETRRDGPFALTEVDEPPRITGLSYVRSLSLGRLADVLLYRAQRSSRPVAVKVFHSPPSYDQAVSLAAEIDAWAALGHAQVVRLLGTGLTSDGHSYVGLAYHRQGSLERALHEGPLPPRQAVRIGLRVAETLAAAHRAGLHHLNLKPSNILLDDRGWPVLTDCGPAMRFTTDPSGALTLPWTPPEIVAATSPADGRSDLYYLAATLWHLLAGRPPFESPGGDNAPAALTERIRHGRLPALGRPDVPAALNHVLRAALDKDPARRPDGAAGFAQALRAVDHALAA